MMQKGNASLELERYERRTERIERKKKKHRHGKCYKSIWQSRGSSNSPIRKRGKSLPVIQSSPVQGQGYLEADSRTV